MKKTAQRHTRLHRLIIFSLFLAALMLTGFFQLEAATPSAAAQLPVVSMGQTSYSVNEGNSINVIVQINTLPSSTMTVTVQYATSGGTAVPGTDYTSVSGIITFTSTSPLQQSVTIQTIRNTATLETRTFNFTLSNPVNATTDTSRSSAIISINNIDAAPTATPTGGTTIIFADALEPNNNFNEASSIDAGAAARCSLTFYPPGDQDYFRWWGQAGVTYEVATSNLVAGIDTLLRVYDSNQNQIGENDDQSPGSRNSFFSFTAAQDGYYYARVTNTIPGDPVNKTYCFGVARLIAPTPTPPPAFPSGADACEFNSTIETACLIVPGETVPLNFIPTLGSEQDTDMFRLWMKPGSTYICETEIPVDSAADTNIILLDGNGNPFNPWIGNDDKEPGNLGSRVQYFSTYTGWLYVEVGPVNVPELEDAPLHTYTLTCTQVVATPTPTPTNTAVPLPPSTGGPISTPTPIPTVAIPTIFPTPTPFDPADFIPTPVPPPLVEVNPLPTATSAAGGGGQIVNIHVTIFYDSNNNYLPELTEGIMDTAVALYDNATGELLSFGHTDEAGAIRFDAIQTTGTVRIVVPYLNYTQVITQTTDEILIRVAPGTLPIGIP